VHGGRAAQPLRGALERAHTPAGHFVHVHVECGFVELDDVDAIRLQRQRLLIQQFGERERELHLVAVVAVGHGVDDRHRAGQRELDLALRVRAQKARLNVVHAALQPQRRHHLRHHRLVAVGADADLDLVFEVDAFDALEEAVHEVLSRLLAVTDRREAGVFLRLDPHQRGVELGLLQRGALVRPARPQLVRLGEPAGLGQAASDRGAKHVGLLDAKGSMSAQAHATRCRRTRAAAAARRDVPWPARAAATRGSARGRSRRRSRGGSPR
jgi:hypothetical protein